MRESKKEKQANTDIDPVLNCLCLSEYVHVISWTSTCRKCSFLLAVIWKFITAVLRKTYLCNPHKVCLDLLLYWKWKVLTFSMGTKRICGSMLSVFCVWHRKTNQVHTWTTILDPTRVCAAESRGRKWETKTEQKNLGSVADQHLTLPVAADWRNSMRCIYFKILQITYWVDWNDWTVKIKRWHKTTLRVVPPPPQLFMNWTLVIISVAY